MYLESCYSNGLLLVVLSLFIDETKATPSTPPPSPLLPRTEQKNDTVESHLSSFVVLPKVYKHADLRHVKKCPTVSYVESVNVNKMLGFWYAYATTPMPHPFYRLECSTYDASNFNFTNNILSTDYTGHAILYYCIYNKKTRNYDITIRVLTRNTSPTINTIRAIERLLEKFQININILIWLKYKAYCFEWFIRSNHAKRRYFRYLAPYNRWNDH